MVQGFASVLGLIYLSETGVRALEGSRVLNAHNVRDQFRQREPCIDSLGLYKGQTSVKRQASGWRQEHILSWRFRHVMPVADACFFMHWEVVVVVFPQPCFINYNENTHAHQRNS